ncbi:MAG TPA: SRPBCC family protein [Bryobacteraceae bacterium]|nr:SRPBCC family protein [Bryobacteraceae bacterium]
MKTADLGNPGKRILNGLLGVALVFGMVWLLIRTGYYGLMLFTVVPLGLGALTAHLIHATTLRQAAWAGAIANLVGSAALLAFGMEGAICMLMAWPLVLPLGALGGVLAYQHGRTSARGPGAAIFALLPIGALGWDFTARPDVFEVRSAIEIAASPEQVWKHVVTFPEIPEPSEWYFHTGLAYPKRARIVGSGAGAVRYCEFSTGPFVEPIEVWDEPRLLRFRVTESPAPMHEWSPYGEILPKHLHGYLVSKQGEFRLTPLAGGRTRLEGRSWYQHGLWPAGYWRVWSNAIIHRIHLRVMNHIKTLAEAEGAPALEPK